MNPELRPEFRLPLRGELRGAKDGQPLRFPGSEELRDDEARLDGLADADTIRDEKPRGLLRDAHHQRHELVVARRHCQRAERPERACCRAEGEPQGVSKQPCAACVSPVVDGRRLEGRWTDLLQGRQQRADLVVHAGQRAREDGAGGRSRQYEPVAATGEHQGTRSELGKDGGHPRFLLPVPNTPG